MTATQSTLDATVREGSGKGAARKLRATGKVPAVIYGKHMETPLHIAVEPKPLRAAVATPKKLNTVITLKLGGKSHQVLLKDYQMDPVTRDVLHADFLEVRDNEQVKVNVPVALVGKAEGVGQGGIMSQQKREIEIWALPSAIPETIEVDVTNLKIAQALHINDVKLPAGITVKTQTNYTIAVVVAPEAEVVATPAAEATAAAAGADGKPAAGDAKAAAGDAKAAAGDAKAGAAAKAPEKKK